VADGWGVGTWSSNSWGGTNVTVSLVGSFALGSAGMLAFSKTAALAGSSGFAVPGSVTFEMAFPLSGRAASGAAGTWVPGKASFLTGAASAYGAVGTVVVVKSVSINGNLATGATGNLGYAYWQLIPDSQNPNWTDIITV